jgi:hypothetical protein
MGRKDTASGVSYAPFLYIKSKRKEGSKMPVKTFIVVSGGMVTDVYSTLPKNEHEIEVLDLDGAGQESFEEKDEMETRIIEISNSKEYNTIF